MITQQEYEALQSEAKELQRAADKAAGAYDQLKAKLKADYGCNDEEAGQKMLTKLEVKANAALATYQAKMDEFKKSTAPKLEE